MTKSYEDRFAEGYDGTYRDGAGVCVSERGVQTGGGGPPGALG